MSTLTNDAAAGALVPPPPRRRRRSAQQATALTAVMFLLPAFLLLVVLRFVPMGDAALASLQRDSLSADGGSWVGLDNYAYLFSLPQFWSTVRVTAIFLLVIVPFQVLIALAFALLLAEKLPGVAVVRVLIFIPVAAPAAVATLVWGVAFRPEGPINAVLGLVGIPAQPFLTSPDQALMAMIILMSWIGIGYWTLFLLAGVQDVPGELYEAAAIDGAGWWRCLWSITLPNISRTILFVVVANTVASSLAFVPVQILTQGGPAGSTRLYMYDLYNTTFLLGDVNLGQAQVVLMLVALVAITGVQFRMLTKEG